MIKRARFDVDQQILREIYRLARLVSEQIAINLYLPHSDVMKSLARLQQDGLVRPVEYAGLGIAWELTDKGFRKIDTQTRIEISTAEIIKGKNRELVALREERDQRIAQRRGVKRIESKIDWLEIDLFYLQRCARASICD